MDSSLYICACSGVTELPDEFQRHFRGLCELDTRVNSVQKQLDDDMIAQLKYIASKQQSGDALQPPNKRQRGLDGSSKKTVGHSSSLAEPGDPELSKRIQQNMNEVIMISEEKMKRAQQIYDLVDQHIRKLDKDLKSFGAEVSKERERLGVQPVMAHRAGGTSDKNKKSVTAVPAPSVPEESKSPEVLYKEALAVADANEPKYCYCKRISFGEMIACENDDCPIEWFHFGCVGLTPENRPKGQWFCPDCKPNPQK